MKKKTKVLTSIVMLFTFTILNVPILPNVKAETELEDGRVNFSLSGKATAKEAPVDYYGAEKAIDGIVNREASDKKQQSRWSSENGAPSWLTVDLQDIRAFDEINIFWERQTVEKYHVEISDDGSVWKTVYESTSKKDGHEQDSKINIGHKEFSRYVKVVVDKLIDGTYPSVSIYEIEIIGDKSNNSFEKEFRVNYALGCDAKASAAPISYWGPDKLVDGIINRGVDKSEQSRWSSERGAPGWVSIDLKESKPFDEILLAWEAGGKIESFHIDASDNGQDYETIYTSEAKPAGYPEDTRVYFESPVNKQYVKVIIDKMTKGAYPSVSMYEVEVIGTKKMYNLAGEATVEAQSEADSVKASNINDGSLETRWGSTLGVNEKIVTFKFDEEKTINSFVLEWERKTAKDYKIEANINGEWKEVIHNTKVPKHFQEIINLDESIISKEIRLVITDFLSNGADRDGQIIDYPTVSLHEVEMYGEIYNIPPRDAATTVQDIANEITVEELAEDATEMKMPTVPDGYEIEFFGADYEQVLTRDRKIIKPLVDTEIVVNFEVKEIETGLTANTPDIKLLVHGKFDKNESNNEKPVVVPELQQWFGESGEFAVSDNTKIVVDPSAKDFEDVANLFASDYEDIVGRKPEVVSGTDPESGDFYFTLSGENLEKETYYLDVKDFTTIKADQYTGAYWATRSILQVLKQTGGTINKGIAKDYPKYELRGMMLDVARLPVEMYFLEDIVKTMSWYKMNDFQVHLNDNVFTHTDGIPDYSGFRLESEVPNLTNTDVFYTKEEFRNFINNSRSMGVNIVPEFDSPGHSGAFTRARPDLARGNEHEYLDVTNPETIKFIKSVFEEYTTGDNPVYPEGTVVHVGTDEYKRGDKEAFRRYQDELLKYVRDDLGYTPRVWGSQTENAGETPITVEGVQMNLWYTGYARPKDMYELGYDLINTNDGDLYIVPGAGYYYDYLNQNHIYGKWQPNVIGGFKVPAGDDQMLGSNFAVWNDKTGPKNDNGTSDIELYDRIYHIMPTFGSKLWGDIKDYSLDELNSITKETNYAPNSNPTYQVESDGDTYVDYDFNNKEGIDNSGNEYNLVEQKNIDYKDGVHWNSLSLQGDESYVETPLTDIGINTTLDFWVNKDATDSDEEQILFESELGAIKAVQKDTGKFGFSRWHRDYSFDYELPENEWVHIKLVSKFTKTSLYVNGELKDELARDKTGGKWASLVTPIERIGSTTNAFKGMVDDIVITSNDKENTVDTRILKQALELANQKLKDGNSYSSESIANLESAISEANKVLENKDITQEEVETALNNLKIAIDGLVKVSDKKALQIAVEVAKKVTDDDLSDIVPAVVKEFKEALAEAEAILTNVNATQEEVDASFDRLSEVMHMLSFKKGDKQALKSLIEKINMLDEKEYIAKTWEKLQKQLEIANKVVTDENALEEEVAKTYENLLRSFLELRLKPSKDKLEELINKAESIDRDKYTEKSVKAIDKALAKANEVFSDEEATEKEIAKVEKNLEIALNNLVEKDNNKDKPGNGDNNGNGSDNENIDESNNGKQNNGGKLPNTGGTSAVALALLGVAMATSGAVISKKKKINKL